MISLPSEHPREERRASLPAAEGGLPPLPQRPAGVQVADRAGARQGQLIPGKKYMMGHTDESTGIGLGPRFASIKEKLLRFLHKVHVGKCKSAPYLTPAFSPVRFVEKC